MSEGVKWSIHWFFQKISQLTSEICYDPDLLERGYAVVYICISLYLKSKDIPVPINSGSIIKLLLLILSRFRFITNFAFLNLARKT